MIIAFTGMRPPKIGGYKTPNPTYNYICTELNKILKELKPERCTTGCALGFDTIAANICFKLSIPYIAAVPFKGQEKVWNTQQQEIYHRLLKNAIEVIIVSEGEYSIDKMQIRNEFMIDKCNMVIGCWNGSNGGTKNCLDYAKSKNKEIIIIDPRKAI